MKKLFTLVMVMLCAASSYAGYYGILVNGKTYFAAEYKGKDSNTGTFDEYLAHVQVKSGDYLQLYDAEWHAAWAVDLDTWSVEGFTRSGDRYTTTNAGCYDFYIKMKYGEDQLYIGAGSNCGSGEDVSQAYGGSVPPQCEAVMMQAFYNESYNSEAAGVSEYGDTKWTTLTAQAAEIGKYFDYVWLPPSANGDGMGYHPKQYSNQNSNWGTRVELDALISALHEAGSKVVADIVINHCTGWSSWCDFPTMDFGDYGVFHPDASYICADDEVNKNPDAGDCYGKATGNNDDGENWEGARDWAHDNVYVQDMFKAYLKWMRNVMHYDGFRYDKGDGFNNWHHDNYNRAAKPEIAFMECYAGDDKIIYGIEHANYNLMALDFQTRWDAICPIAGWKYGGVGSSGLLGKGLKKYAVTFMDSHDWFLRPDNENEFGGRGNSMTSDLKDRLMQANASLLAMPGVPCVFYPHWKKYKEDLKPMIEARKWAGVHSESNVTDVYISADGNGYQATIEGKYGYLILLLGDKTTHSATGDYSWLSSYKLMAKGNGYAMWVNRTAPIPTDVEEVESEETKVKSEKFLQNGQLFIRKGDKTYNVMGQLIK